MIVPSKELEILWLSKKLKLELQGNTSFSDEVFDVSGWVAFIYILFHANKRANKCEFCKTFQFPCTDKKVLPKC